MTLAAYTPMQETINKYMQQQMKLSKSVIKPKYVTRYGITAMLIMTHNVDVFQELVTTARLYKTTPLEIGYQYLSAGMTELGQLGVIARTRKTVHNVSDTTMGHRSFIANISKLSLADMREFIKLCDTLITMGHSQETLASCAAISGAIKDPDVIKRGGRFTQADYERYLIVPQQKTKYMRTPGDSGGLVDYDQVDKTYRVTHRWKEIGKIHGQINATLNGLSVTKH